MARTLFNFYIDDDLAEGLKTLTARDDVTAAAACRRAIREYLTRKGILKAPTRRQRPSIRKRKGDQ
jgi:hypothetical protein